MHSALNIQCTITMWTTFSKWISIRTCVFQFEFFVDPILYSSRFFNDIYIWNGILQKINVFDFMRLEKNELFYINVFFFTSCHMSILFGLSCLDSLQWSYKVWNKTQTEKERDLGIQPFTWMMIRSFDICSNPVSRSFFLCK